VTHLSWVSPNNENRTVTPLRRPNAELRTREHLTADKVEALMTAAKGNRYGHRDARFCWRTAMGCALVRWSTFGGRISTLPPARPARAYALSNFFCARAESSSDSRNLARPSSVRVMTRFRRSRGSTSCRTYPSRTSGFRLCASAPRSNTKSAASAPTEGAPERAMWFKMARWVGRLRRRPSVR
jgi:hypothetical protein